MRLWFGGTGQAPYPDHYGRLMATGVPARAIWALGVTQIIGYGTLYYAFSVLSPAIGVGFGWSAEWVFGALSLALLAGGLMSPVAGHFADRLGAARIMAVGSVFATVTLSAAALAPNGYTFAAALIAMEITAAFVLYPSAFAALVQLGGRNAQRSITHLTLIAGFASTLFWPLTAWLHTFLDWRAVFLVFALLHLLVAAPLHLWLLRQTPPVRPDITAEPPAPEPLVPDASHATGLLPAARRSQVFALLLAGFAIEGFILAGMLLHLVPLLGTLGLGTSAVLVTTLFGPAQVLGRLSNMLVGAGLRQTNLGVFAALLLPLGVLVLATTSPSLPGAIVFAILFGMGSGLISIVSGSLPLELFGRDRYGSRLGWLSSARQIASALAPFVIALTIGKAGTMAALWAVTVAGIFATAAFVAIAASVRQADGTPGRPVSQPG